MGPDLEQFLQSSCFVARVHASRPCRQAVLPAFNRLAEDFAEDPSVIIASLNCTRDPSLCAKLGARGCPRVWAYSQGHKQSVKGWSYDASSAAVARLKELAAAAEPPNDGAAASTLVQTTRVREKTSEVVHEGRTFSIPRLSLMASCEIFKDDPTLLASPYQVKSNVSDATFGLFVAAIEGSDPVISHENSAELALLCDEFGFQVLGDKVQDFVDLWTAVLFKGETVHVLRDKLVQTCHKFRDCSSLLTEPYQVESSVSCDVFRVFMNAVGGVSPIITNENVSDFALLCDEFGHEDLSAVVSEFVAQQSSAGKRALREVPELKAQNAALRAQIFRQGQDIAVLQRMTALQHGPMGFLSLAIHVILELFPEMDPEQVAEWVRGAFPAWSATRVYEWIQKSFPERVGTARQALLAKQAARDFPPKMNKVEIICQLRSSRHYKFHVKIDVPDGIIAYLSKEYQGNVHGEGILEVTFGSLEGETYGTDADAKNVADFAFESCFSSCYRAMGENIPHTRNNWVCYDFKDRRVVPTHYTIRTSGDSADAGHLKSWLVETSADGESWREAAREENNTQLNGPFLSGTFPVAGGGEWRFIRLVNIGRNHRGDDQLMIQAWEIFGSLIE
jgi:hypothetical protein